MGQIQSIDEFINLVLRRRWWIALIVAFGCLVSVVYAKMQPSVYEAAAVIQIQAAQVTNAGAAPNSGSAQLLQTIQQQLTTREALTALIERHNLFADQPALPLDKRIFALRTAITFQTVDSAAGQGFGEGRNLSAIIIMARDSNPETAAVLANDFAQRILDQTSSGQRSRVDQNFGFFQDNVTRLATAITALETEVAAYKTSRSESLPELLSTRKDELVNLTDDIRAASQQVAALESEAAVIQAKQTTRATDTRRLAEIAAQMSVLQGKIAASNADKVQVDTAISAMTETERVLAGFDRRLTQLQSQYDAANQSLAEATNAQQLAENQQSERFSLLERAVTPEYATGGGKKKIAVAGAFASILAALGFALFLDILRPVVRTSAQMQRQLGLEPVVCIPEVQTGKAVPSRWWRKT